VKTKWSAPPKRRSPMMAVALSLLLLGGIALWLSRESRHGTAPHSSDPSSDPGSNHAAIKAQAPADSAQAKTVSPAPEELGVGSVEEPSVVDDPGAAPPVVQQAVTIFLRLSDAKFGSEAEVTRLQELELKVEQAIVRAGTGEVDGNEIGLGEYIIFTYGQDADALYASIAPVLEASRLSKGGHVLKRYGSEDDETAREVRVDLQP
jgi:hypothetical protein